MLDNPFFDWAADVLTKHPELDDATKADLWDIAYEATNPEQLAQFLRARPVPEEVKSELCEAKKNSMTPVSQLVAAINTMSRVDPTVLNSLEKEKDPEAVKQIIDTVTRGE